MDAALAKYHQNDHYIKNDRTKNSNSHAHFHIKGRKRKLNEAYRRKSGDNVFYMDMLIFMPVQENKGNIEKIISLRF